MTKAELDAEYACILEERRGIDYGIGDLPPNLEERARDEAIEHVEKVKNYDAAS